VVEKRVLQKTGEAAAGIASGSASEMGSADVAEEGEVSESVTFTNEELREFLEADTAGDLADPEFKERLRQRLWDMLRRRNAGSTPEDH
jgi:hypothetical protein